MKIAVLGGGTAGFIAAAHLTRHVAGGGAVARVRLAHSHHRRGRGYDPAVSRLVRGGHGTRFSRPGRALRRDPEEGHPL